MRKLILVVFSTALLSCNEPAQTTKQPKVNYPLYNENGEEVSHDTI